MAFLQQISAVIITQATARLGLSASQLPKIALIAVGSAGRGEYSPFVPLQILIVHEEVQAQNQTIDLFCQYLHAGFEAAGLSIDSDVTPQNPNWRGTLVEWQQRCEDGMHPQTELELINIWRLVDQCPLCPGDGFALELKPICAVALNGSRLALTNLFERMILLSNGLGIMGRLKLERSGSERGLFRLQEHGLLPLSAAISALALIKGSQAVSTCNRVHDLLKHGELDVDLAERMLSTWYSLHDLRLRREQSCHLFEPSSRPSFLNPDELTVDQRQTLKKNLETVAKIQRQVEVIYSGIGDKIL
jgi:signal-transduction protein with cAMP-binding, CBS, and nucleotidyltransferase domain